MTSLTVTYLLLVALGVTATALIIILLVESVSTRRRNVSPSSRRGSVLRRRVDQSHTVRVITKGRSL